MKIGGPLKKFYFSNQFLNAIGQGENFQNQFEISLETEAIF